MRISYLGHLDGLGVLSTMGRINQFRSRCALLRIVPSVLSPSHARNISAEGLLRAYRIRITLPQNTQRIVLRVFIQKF